MGGGVANWGNLFIENTTVEANLIRSLRKCRNPFVCPRGGEHPTFYYSGAGIYNIGVAVLGSGTNIIANELPLSDPLPSSYYGGGIYNIGTLTLQLGSKVNLNYAFTNGSGIFNGGILTLDAGSEAKNNSCNPCFPDSGRNIANFGTLTNNGDIDDGQSQSIYPPAP